MKAKDRRELDREQNQTYREVEQDWEIRRWKEEIKQEQLRRRRIRRDQEYDIILF